MAPLPGLRVRRGRQCRSGLINDRATLSSWRSSWQWQTAIVFLSPSARRLLARMKSPLSKILSPKFLPLNDRSTCRTDRAAPGDPEEAADAGRAEVAPLQAPLEGRAAVRLAPELQADSDALRLPRRELPRVRTLGLHQDFAQVLRMRSLLIIMAACFPLPPIGPTPVDEVRQSRPTRRHIVERNKEASKVAQVKFGLAT